MSVCRYFSLPCRLSFIGLSVCRYFSLPSRLAFIGLSVCRFVGSSLSLVVYRLSVCRYFSLSCRFDKKLWFLVLSASFVADVGVQRPSWIGTLGRSCTEPRCTPYPFNKASDSNERRYLVFGGVHGDYNKNTFIVHENLKNFSKSYVRELSEEE